MLSLIEHIFFSTKKDSTSKDTMHLKTATTVVTLTATTMRPATTLTIITT